MQPNARLHCFIYDIKRITLRRIIAIITFINYEGCTMSKLVIENNAFENLCVHVNNYYKAGYIAVIYENGYEKLALDIAAALEKGNYRCRTVSADGKASAHLNDEYRYIVGVGAEVICDVLKTTDKPYCVCLTQPTFKCYDNSFVDVGENLTIKIGHAADLVVIDKKHTVKEWQSALWGEIMRLMQIVIDYGIVKYVSSHANVDTYNNILAVIDTAMMADVPDNDKLLEIYAEIAKYYGDILNNDINDTVRIAAMLIAKNKNISYGDACMLCGVYYVHASYDLIGSDVELAFPPDKDALKEQAARKFGLQRIAIERNYIVKNDAIMRYDYVINEYCDDIRQMIAERFAGVNNACKIWRRLKKDVGYGISRAITIREIGEAVGSASILGRGYGIVRHYKEMGIA